MIRILASNNGIFVAQDPIVHWGPHEIEFLKAQIHGSSRKRTRLCVHKDPEDRLQEMLIVAARDSYIRAGKHVGKEESIHVIEGAADLVFFDENGNAINLVALGAPASGRSFYCNIPAETYHAMIIRSPYLVYHECTLGPFRKSDTIFPSWAPDDEDAEGIRKHLSNLENQLAQIAAK